MENGSPTAIEIAGIVFDMNRINRKEYFRLMREIQALQKEGEPDASEEDFDKAQQLSGKLYTQVIVSWPFPEPITAESYLSLGMMDSQLVDDAFAELGKKLEEKKLERLSTLLPNTASPSMILSSSLSSGMSPV